MQKITESGISPTIVGEMKIWWVKWAGHVALVGEMEKHSELGITFLSENVKRVLENSTHMVQGNA